MRIPNPHELADQLRWSCKVIYDMNFMYEQIRKEVGGKTITRIASPYLNFRDALFHFKKAIDAHKAGDRELYISQVVCIDEHINRGNKDFVIDVIYNYCEKPMFRMLISGSPFFTPGKHKELRKIYHGFKNLVVHIRLGGQEIAHLDDPSNTLLEQLIEMRKKFNQFKQTNPGLHQLYRQIVLNS